MLLCPARQTGTGRILNLLGKNGDSFSILDRLPFFFFHGELIFHLPIV